MNILHYYPASDSMIRHYATMLEQSMSTGTVCFFATDLQQGLRLLQMADIQILHVHGCWRTSAARLYRAARKRGVRLVISPHGQLEPWIVNTNYWSNKLPRMMAFQRSMIRKSYTVVVQGNMELECMKRLGWNPRVVVVRNPIITCLTTPQQTALQLHTLYRRIMDSNPLQLMDNATLNMLRTVIKAGICKDLRWLSLPSDYQLPQLSQEAWRQLLCYADQQHISDIMDRGMLLLKCPLPDIDIQHSEPFIPERLPAVKSITEAIGLQYTSENERLQSAFKYLHKLIDSNQLTIKHLCELSKELREYGCDEEQLQDNLRERGLLQEGRRIMHLLADFTGLDEGFMPLSPLDDSTTHKIRQQIKNQYSI